jgi:phosphoglycerate dehydrogenase-like enzyme
MVNPTWLNQEIHVISLLTSKYCTMDDRFRSSIFSQKLQVSMPHILADAQNGKTIGIIGTGHAGTMVRVKAEGLGMSTILNDPPLAQVTGETGIDY